MIFTVSVRNILDRPSYDHDVPSCYIVINRENVMVYIINKSVFSLYLLGHKLIFLTSLCVLIFRKVLETDVPDVRPF
jgi:hypothetical protein